MFKQQQHNKYAAQSSGAYNRSSIWTALLLIVIVAVAMFYAIPNVFGYDPAVQISSSMPGTLPSQQNLVTVEQALKTDNIYYRSAQIRGKKILVRFKTPLAQLDAKQALTKQIGDKFIVATVNATRTPTWLLAIGAQPMKLGLDLQGGMTLLLQVDIDSIIKQRQQNSVKDLAQVLRSARLPYTAMIPSASGIRIVFAQKQAMQQAKKKISADTQFSQFVWQDQTQAGTYQLIGSLSPTALQQVRQYTMDKTLTILSHRVNELGVSEAQVQQAGADRVQVSLPGVSDATQAQDILGKTATIRAYLVDQQHDAQQAETSGNIPAGDLLYKKQNGQPYLLKNDVVLSGDNIVSASASMSQEGTPQVAVQVASAAQNKLYTITNRNLNKPMAVVYSETKSKLIHGKKGEKPKIVYKKTNTIISVATIQSAFSSNFVTTGLESPQVAQQLALLLRAGSLLAPVTILSEKQIGPSMGAANVASGKLAIEIGLLVVVLFMALYYRTMGIIANLALVVNLVLIVAIMSLLGATLTFPGIASLVLTIGMAVDGNVLIFERIREELRNGSQVQAAIHSGYDRAVVTIVDAQLTTLIAAIVLFSIGNGPIKGFAIVLTIGLFTSMLTSITYTRMIVNFLYGGKRLQQLSIGIRVKHKQAANETVLR